METTGEKSRWVTLKLWKSSGSSAEVRREHLLTTVSMEENHSWHIYFEDGSGKEHWRSCIVYLQVSRESPWWDTEKLWFGWETLELFCMRAGRLWLGEGDDWQWRPLKQEKAFKVQQQNVNHSLIYSSVYFPQIYWQQLSEKRSLLMQVPQIYKKAWTVRLDSAPWFYKFKKSLLKSSLTTCLSQFHWLFSATTCGSGVCCPMSWGNSFGILEFVVPFIWSVQLWV